MEPKLSSILFLCFASVALSTTHQSATLQQEDDYRCVYTVYVRTSKTLFAGTDSKISVAVYDESGSGIRIKDLETWGGAMGEGHDYFERGNLDIFTGRGPCLSYPICAMELTSDGSGPHPDWYCNYVEVTSTGPQTPCAQVKFTVEQWLKPSGQLSTRMDNCSHGALRHLPQNILDPVEPLLALELS